MSPEVAVSVPGKAILLGEHAAVYGHPALVTAVDLRLSVIARVTELPGVTIAGVAPFRTGTLLREEVDDLCRGTAAPGDRLAYLACGAALLEASAAEHLGIEIAITSEIPPGSGLGSSAALAVGVVASVLSALELRPDADTIARVARRVETRQHGRPSGVDVEAVLRGGTLWCERDGAKLVCTALEPGAAPLHALELYHAGTPGESTGEMVADVTRRLEDAPGPVLVALREIEEATLQARSLLDGTPAKDLHPRLQAALTRAEAALEALGVVPDAAARAIREIEAAGGAAKISGAGGRTGGAGLVLVLPPPGGMVPIPAGWTRLTRKLHARGLLEDVAA